MLSVDKESDLPIGYADFLADLKTRIRSTQVSAVLSVNRELVLLYWDIGQRILGQQQREGWGTKVIDRLAMDLKRAFPDMKGFGSRNLKYMRSFAEAYPDRQFVQQVVAQIPWGHNVRILDHTNDPDERGWYVCQTIENGWSRNVLVHQIESGLYQRKGKAISNFPQTLPATHSDLVQQTLKDPYVFDFLMLDENVREFELEQALTEHIREFLLELGAGFAFVGRQVSLEVDGQDFYLDLLFYHLELRCFVVIDLKTGEFKPEYAGKMNFYLSVVDDRLRHPGDTPSVGIILCKSRSQVIVQYSLRDTSKPMGVAAYQLTHSLPEEMKGSLPSIEELEAELEGLGCLEGEERGD